MKTNMGGTDKIARIIVAFLLVILYFKGIVTGVLGNYFIGSSRSIHYYQPDWFFVLYILYLDTAHAKQRISSF